MFNGLHRSDSANSTKAYTRKYAYDKMGNILELAHIAASSPDSFTRIFNPDISGYTPEDYGSTGNLLHKVKIAGIEHTMDYDAAGNLISENADRNYEWDAFDRMKSFRVQVFHGIRLNFPTTCISRQALQLLN